jgi:hypothetical protein
MRKLKEKWVNDSNTLAELRIRVGVLENEKNAFGVQNSENSELEKSKKNNEAFVGSDNVQTNEPPSNDKIIELCSRCIIISYENYAQGASLISYIAIMIFFSILVMIR